MAFNEFLANIRRWLELTAEDKLHQGNEPLEAFLASNMGPLIVPPDYNTDETLSIYSIKRKAHKLRLNPIGIYTNQFWDILRTVAEIGAKHLPKIEE